MVVSEDNRGELPEGVYYYKDIFDCDVIDEESGKRLAKNLISAGFADIMELSNDIAILEIDIKK